MTRPQAYGGGESFHSTRKQLEVHRDGGLAPDRFYLGEIPGSLAGTFSRFFACLDTPFTIEVPRDEPERERWIGKTRVCRLHPDFIPHLHARIFGSVARRGFDDHEWLSNSDLEVLLRRGEAERQALEATAAQLRADVDTIRLDQGSEKKISHLEKQIANAQKKIDRLDGDMSPFLAERDRRVDSEKAP